MEITLETPVKADYPPEGIMGSRNHSYLQSVLVAELFNSGQFVVYTELSLDIDHKEYVPDIALYPKDMAIDSFQEDVLRMTEMPLCAIEILSPRQFIESITEKFKAYFSAGIQSCWLVVPNPCFISVYRDFKTYQLFSNGEVIDEKLNIRLPLARIFQPRS